MVKAESSIPAIPIPSSRRQWLRLCEALVEDVLKAQQRPVEFRVGDLTLTLTSFIGVCAESLGYAAHSHYDDQSKTWTLTFKPRERM